MADANVSWDFGIPIDEINKSFNPEEASGYVLKTHLGLEYLLTVALSIHFKHPQALDEMRLTFVNKVQLALALGLLSESEKRAFLAMNALRNRLAHDYHYKLCLEDGWRLFKNLPSAQQERKDDKRLKNPSVCDLLLLSAVITVIMANGIVERALACRATDHIVSATVDDLDRPPDSRLKKFNALEEVLPDVEGRIAWTCGGAAVVRNGMEQSWQLEPFAARLRPGSISDSFGGPIIHLILSENEQASSYDAHYLREPNLGERLATRIARHLRGLTSS